MVADIDPFSDDAGPAPRPTRPRRLPRGRAVGRAGIAVTLIAILTVFAREEREAKSGSPAIRPDSIGSSTFVSSAGLAARPALPLTASGPRFRLDDPDGLDPVRSGAPRLDPASGRREDTLTQGDFSGIEGPYLRITVTEGTVSDPARSLFVTIARRGADGQGLSVVKTGERGLIQTKFGPVETLEVTLSGSGRRICTGFATLGTAPVRLDGWLCAPLGQPPEPTAIACALDKFVVNGQASPGLEAAFRTAETRRDARCLGRAAGVLRETIGQTGSIQKPRERKNKAELRRTAQARP